MYPNEITVKKIGKGVYNVVKGDLVIATFTGHVFANNGAFYTVTSGVLAGTQSFDRIALLDHIRETFNA
jgi:hypothetical protein